MMHRAVTVVDRPTSLGRPETLQLKGRRRRWAVHNDLPPVYKAN